MLEDYRILTQQIKLKNLIIACFIPPDYQDKIMQHCHWQDYEGSWNIDFLPYAGERVLSSGRRDTTPQYMEGTHQLERSYSVMR